MSGAKRRTAETAFGAMNLPPEMMAMRKQPSATDPDAKRVQCTSRPKRVKCARDADGNESLSLRLLHIVSRFLAFACRFKPRAADRFDQSLRRHTFVVGDDRFARHDVHAYVAYTGERLDRPPDG